MQPRKRISVFLFLNNICCPSTHLSNLIQLWHNFINTHCIQLVDSIYTMASQTQGIQQLLTAEKRAAEKVAEARKRKARRIKQAREEAQAEIENYRRERERQFREYEAKYMGSREDIAAKIDKNTEMMLSDVDSDVKNNKEKVLADLLYLVLNVKPEVHPNYKIMRVFGKI